MMSFFAVIRLRRCRYLYYWKFNEFWVGVFCIVFIATLLCLYQREPFSSEEDAVVIDLSKNYFQPINDLATWKYLVENDKCKIPEIDLLTRLVQPLITKAPNSKCHESLMNLTYVHGKELIINAPLLAEKGYTMDKISCCYNTIERVEQSLEAFLKDPDILLRYSEDCYPMKEEVIVPKSEFVKVTCTERRLLPGGLSYVNFHAVPTLEVKYVNKSNDNIQRKLSFWQNCLKASQKEGVDQPINGENNQTCQRILTKGLPPNILMLGIDSTSRLNSRRFMPRTLEILEKIIDAQEIKGYTKVGENTFPNLAPILTSFSQEEITKLCYQNKSKPLDECPFMWKKFDEQNYLTVFLEDAPKIAMCNYFNTGFLKSPVDIYLRPFMIAAYNHTGDWPYNVDCIGNQRPEEVVLNYIVNLASVAESNQIPYFITSWLTDLTHDDMNNLQTLDDVLANTLLTLHDRGLLKNTILLIMSDHGYRYLEIRETMSGWYEDKLPMMWIKLPDSVVNAHPSWLEALRYNSRQLSTPFDLHATLVEILDKFVVLEVPHVQTLSEMKARFRVPDLRGLSLLEKLPFRSCDDAGIPSQFCACVQPVEYKANLTFVELAGKAIVQDINESLPSVCSKFKLGYVTASGTFLADKNATISPTIHADDELPELLIVAVRTVPGDLRFEAWVTYDKATKTFTNVLHRLRLNKIDKTKVSCLSAHNLWYEQICYCI